jgi:hypothetical protein
MNDVGEVVLELNRPQYVRDAEKARQQRVLDDYAAARGRASESLTSLVRESGENPSANVAEDLPPESDSEETQRQFAELRGEVHRLRAELILRDSEREEMDREERPPAYQRSASPPLGQHAQ